MLPKNYSLRKILVVFSFFEIYCTRVGNSERFSQGKHLSLSQFEVEKWSQKLETKPLHQAPHTSFFWLS